MSFFHIGWALRKFSYATDGKTFPSDRGAGQVDARAELCFHPPEREGAPEHAKARVVPLPPFFPTHRRAVDQNPDYRQGMRYPDTSLMDLQEFVSPFRDLRHLPVIAYEIPPALGKFVIGAATHAQGGDKKRHEIDESGDRERQAENFHFLAVARAHGRLMLTRTQADQTRGLALPQVYEF